MTENTGNLFDALPAAAGGEAFTTLAAAGGTRIERIVSNGQATPPGEWYDQAECEWVLLLRGSAGLRFEDEDGIRTLRLGDWLTIPAHARHRVEWTDPESPTVWLAVHYAEGMSGTQR